MFESHVVERIPGACPEDEPTANDADHAALLAPEAQQEAFSSAVGRGELTRGAGLARGTHGRQGARAGREAGVFITRPPPPDGEERPEFWAPEAERENFPF